MATPGAAGVTLYRCPVCGAVSPVDAPCDAHPGVERETLETERERWVTRDDVAEHLGVSIDTVDELARRGMPSIKLSPEQRGRRRFKLSEVDDWLARD